MEAKFRRNPPFSDGCLIGFNTIRAWVQGRARKPWGVSSGQIYSREWVNQVLREANYLLPARPGGTVWGPDGDAKTHTNSLGLDIDQRLDEAVSGRLLRTGHYRLSDRGKMVRLKF